MLYFFVLAFVLRLVAINQGLWLDEAIGAIAAKQYSFIDIVTVFLRNDNHPPLYYLLLKAWASVFGFSDIALRLPTVILGSLSVVMVYKLTKKYVPGAAVLAALFTAASPFLIYYSQEVRMYMPTVFLTLSAVFFFLDTFEDKRNRYSWYLFSLSVCALLFTDYVPVFLLPVFPLYALLKRARTVWWRSFGLSFVPLVVLGIAWLPILQVQISGGATVLSFLPEWKGLAGGATLKQLILVWNKFLLGRISIRPQSVYFALILLFSIPVIYALIRSFISKRSSFITFVWLWLLVPPSVCFLVSFLFPAFIYFRLSFVVPAFFILIAHGISQIKNQATSFAITISVLVCSTVGLYVYATQPHQQREQWREAVSFVESTAPSGAISLFEFPDSFAPYRWYTNGIVPGVGGLSEIKSQGESEKGVLLSKIEKHKTIYYFSYLQDLTDPDNIVRSVLVENGYLVKKEVGDFQGVGIITIWERP